MSNKDEYRSKRDLYGFPPFYVLELPGMNAITWLRTYGKGVPHPYPEYLYPKSGSVYVRQYCLREMGVV